MTNRFSSELRGMRISLGPVTPFLAVLLAGFLFILATASGPAASIGSSTFWLGTLMKSGQPLAVRVAINQEPSGRYTGSFSSETQAIMDYPFDSVTVTGQHIAFVLGGGDVRFSGTMSDRTISGSFDGAEGHGTFLLHRAEAPVLPYRAEDVTFANGDVTLKGTLCVPNGRGPFPAVVLLHGSGPESRWGTIRFIADRLARAGIAALAYDKRGSGASTGDWRTVGYEALADDAIAGINLLAKRSDIDLKQIGLWGHSQGGFIAPLVAQRSGHVAFIVAADSNASTTREQDVLRVTNEIRDNGWTGRDAADARALHAHFLDVASAGGAGYDKLEAEVKQDKGRPYISWMAIPPRTSWIWKWYPLVANYDSRTYWKTVRVPVLLVYGQNDELSDVKGSIASIGALVAAAGGPAVKSIVIPGAPHVLHIAPASGKPFFWWYMAHGYPSAEIDWIRAVTHLTS